MQKDLFSSPPDSDRAGAAEAAASEPGGARLADELRAAITRELLRSWHFINGSHFRSALTAPTLGLHAGAHSLGMWQADTRTLLFSENFVLAEPWGIVLEVLKHEMAHQYVHEILGRRDESAHGPAFQSVCARLGIDATASGLPQTRPADSENDDQGRLLRRIARLLALAESHNAHEAEAAMHEAQRLMLKHNLDRQQFDATSKNGPEKRRYAFRQLGTPKGRIDEAQRLLAMVLGRYFFVEAIWVPGYDPRTDRRGTLLEICGTDDNLEMAAYVHDFLLHTAERLWTTHKQAAGIRGDRERRTYLAGVMLGFAERLADKEREQQVQGLVWKGDLVLQDYFRRRHPHVRRVHQKGQPRTQARAEGKKAGRQIVLSRPLTSGPSSSHVSRLLLPSRRDSI